MSVATREPIVPAPRPLPGYSRVTGEPIVLMPSASEPGVMPMASASWVAVRGVATVRPSSERPTARERPEAPGPGRGVDTDSCR